MDIERALANCGTAAVLHYRAMAQTRYDNEVPESFLRAHVAQDLHERFARTIHVERPYTALALDLGLEITPDILSMMGTHCADLAIYENGRPSSVIEMEITCTNGSHERSMSSGPTRRWRLIWALRLRPISFR